MTAVGSCAGYQVHSELPFATLRAPSPGPPLYVGEAHLEDVSGVTLLEWPARPRNQFHGRLLAVNGGYAFWASDAGWYIVDPRGSSITVAVGSDPVRRELRMFGVPTALCALERGDISVHAAAVEIAGRALLIAGPSHHGKTTLAAAIAAVGHRLLSEDTTVCSSRDGPVVYPGPAAVRLRQDVAARVDVVGDAVTVDDRTRILIPQTARGDGRAVPLHAILFLRERDGIPTLSRVESAVALRDILALTLRLPTPESRAACFARVANLASQVECLDLARPMTMDSIPDVIALVEDVVASGL